MKKIIFNSLRIKKKNFNCLRGKINFFKFKNELKKKKCREQIVFYHNL